MSRIVVVDLGTGNLHSVSKALEQVAPGRTVEITRDPVIIQDAGHVVLPGQVLIPKCQVTGSVSSAFPVVQVPFLPDTPFGCMLFVGEGFD